MGGVYSQGNRVEEDVIIDRKLIEKDEKCNDVSTNSQIHNNCCFQPFHCLCFSRPKRKNYRLEVDTNEYVHVFENACKVNIKSAEDEQNAEMYEKNQILLQSKIQGSSPEIKLQKSFSDYDNFKLFKNENYDGKFNLNKQNNTLNNAKCGRSVSLRSFCKLHNSIKTNDVHCKLLSESENRGKRSAMKFISIPDYLAQVNNSFRENFLSKVCDNNIDHGRCSSERQANISNVSSFDYFEKSAFHQTIPLLKQPNPPSSILYEEIYIDDIDSPCINHNAPLASMDTIDIGNSRDSLDEYASQSSKDICASVHADCNFKLINKSGILSNSENPLNCNNQHRSNIKKLPNRIKHSLDLHQKCPLRNNSLPLKPIATTAATVSAKSFQYQPQKRKQLFYSMVFNRQLSIPEHEGTARMEDVSLSSINQMSVTSETIFNDINFNSDSINGNYDSMNNITCGNTTAYSDANNVGVVSDSSNNLVSKTSDSNYAEDYILLDVETYISLLDELQNCRSTLVQLQQYLLSDLQV
ncbi:hypothetical protein HELRODRAFT_160991 [Helobdella robusta]|uniref:Uncharacterized protein n=1 Tax=Helobdella robusta TaxID=6412 RepID=T1EQZ1_HELRO|nr:hypothetical protein HELRODRAFT_160991 [Helobdella robusta]ESO01822.1 hypothetical protein HELRODRAFT_160991 [Helobdella robusta]